MKVHIVCYEDLDAWILGKFAGQLCKHLNKQGVSADVSKVPDAEADINHHIIYTYYDGRRSSTDTVMVTHIDTPWKLRSLKSQLVNAEMGICMSADTVRKLSRYGLPREKLCYVNPAHDGVMRPRKLVIGITSKVQPTGCKRESLLVDLAGRISAGSFRFEIMGAGWESVVAKLRERGVEVMYHDHFDYKAYCEVMPRFDFYLYLGEDEGSMGFLDALAAGVPTIVTPQGFHLDVPGGITYAFHNGRQLADAFAKIEVARRHRVHSVSSWTWEEYARQHLLIWEDVLNRTVRERFQKQHRRRREGVGEVAMRGLGGARALGWRCLSKAGRVLTKVLSFPIRKNPA